MSDSRSMKVAPEIPSYASSGAQHSSGDSSISKPDSPRIFRTSVRDQTTRRTTENPLLGLRSDEAMSSSQNTQTGLRMEAPNRNEHEGTLSPTFGILRAGSPGEGCKRGTSPESPAPKVAPLHLTAPAGIMGTLGLTVRAHERLNRQDKAGPIKKLDWVMAISGFTFTTPLGKVYSIFTLLLSLFRFISSLQLALIVSGPSSRNIYLAECLWQVMAMETQGSYLRGFQTSKATLLMMELVDDNRGGNTERLEQQLNRYVRWTRFLAPGLMFLFGLQIIVATTNAVMRNILIHPFTDFKIGWIMVAIFIIQALQYCLGVAVFVICCRLLNQRYQDLVDAISSTGIVSVGEAWERHRVLCYLTTRLDKRFQRFSTLCIGLNVLLVLLLLNTILFVEADADMRAALFTWLSIAAGVIAIHCTCSIRIVSWHHRLRRAVMDVNSKMVDPSTAHMLTLLSTRLESVTPGLTVFAGSITITSRLVISCVSLTSSVFFFLVNIQRGVKKAS